MSILFFWLERGGREGSSPSTSPADHQKFNVIQKWAFYFLARQGGRCRWSQAFNFFWTGEGWWTGFESIDLPGQSPEVKCNPKMSILFFWLERGGRWEGFESIDQPGWSSEVERNPKMRILFFWLERGGRQGSSPAASPANHQKLNIIQKWAFYFFDWRGAVDGIRVHRPARPIIRS